MFCLGLASCAGFYTPDELPERNIVVSLEISPGEDPMALVHLSNSILDTLEAFYYPTTEEEAKINLSLDPNSIGRMSYAQTPGLFTSQTIPFEEGETYFLSIEMPSKEVKTLTAATTIPFAEQMEGVILQSSTINVVGEVASGEVILNIELPQAMDPQAFYHLVPSIINEEAAAMGVVQYDQIPNNEIEILTDQTGLKQFIHKNGIFIDNSMIETSNVGLKLNYLINPQSIEDVDSVSITLRTINQESMVYHENTDKELRISSLPLDEPQISSNNIENGYGLFGAYSTHTITVPIN